jgi:nucleotide-binding universal stress UspA family protein
MNGERNRVVAAVAPTDYRQPMVLWAAAEAAARDAELLLVTAVPPEAAPELYLPSDAADTRREAGLAHLVEAAEQARAAHPGLLVMTDVVAGAPVEVLRSAAVDAALVVVGADDQSPFAEAIAGSVPGSLLTTSPCPLAVVPHGDQPGDVAAPVIAALDEAGTAQSALAYAFAAADRTGRPLTVLRCLPSGKDDHAGKTPMLTAFRELYPHVDVTDDVAVGDPKDVLAQRSRRAALLVLGSRGHGRLSSTLFGSVGRDLIRRSECPVVIARPSVDDVVAGALG